MRAPLPSTQAPTQLYTTARLRTTTQGCAVPRVCSPFTRTRTRPQPILDAEGTRLSSPRKVGGARRLVQVPAPCASPAEDDTSP
ncbi:hypothetical protein C8R44DRAFT_825462, partial [Mycena epipterygia]